MSDLPNHLPDGHKLSAIARALGETTRNVRRRIEAGELKAYRLGPNNIIVLDPDYREFLDKRKIEVAA